MLFGTHAGTHQQDHSTRISLGMHSAQLSAWELVGTTIPGLWLSTDLVTIRSVQLNPNGTDSTSSHLNGSILSLFPPSQSTGPRMIWHSMDCMYPLVEHTQTFIFLNCCQLCARVSLSHCHRVRVHWSGEHEPNRTDRPKPRPLGIVPYTMRVLSFRFLSFNCTPVTVGIILGPVGWCESSRV